MPRSSATASGRTGARHSGHSASASHGRLEHRSTASWEPNSPDQSLIQAWYSGSWASELRQPSNWASQVVRSSARVRRQVPSSSIHRLCGLMARAPRAAAASTAAIRGNQGEDGGVNAPEGPATGRGACCFGKTMT